MRRRPGQGGRLRDFGEDAAFVPPGLDLDPTSLTWWPATRRGHYLPAGGPTSQRLAAALGAWLALLLLAVWLPVGLVPVQIGLWALVLAAAAVVTRLLRQRLAAERAERTFLARTAGRVVYGRPGTEPYQLGERLTARLLEDYLAALPGIRIFHGLAWPGSVFADIDHAVLRGRRLVLIESKLWLPGHYWSDGRGAIHRNGHRFRGGDVRLTEGLPAYRELLPGIEVRGVLIVHPSRTGEISTEIDTDALIPPMTQEQFVVRIGEWLAGAQAPVDSAAFRLVRGQLSDEE